MQELVRLNGGTIAVASEEGRARTFTVRLPFGIAHLPADRIAAERAAPATASRAAGLCRRGVALAVRTIGGAVGTTAVAPTAAGRTAARGGRVLLADDNADMRDYVGRLLAGQGYEVEAVGDGEAALAAAAPQPARPCALRRDDAAPGRVRPAARAARRSRSFATGR